MIIRDGKRSISQELIQFMELIDEICVESEVIRAKKKFRRKVWRR